MEDGVTDSLIRLTVYRPLDGLRAPYVITLDHMRNVVSDEVDTAELARIKSDPLLLSRHTLNHAAPLPTADEATLVYEPADSKETKLLEQGFYIRLSDTGVMISKEPPTQLELKLRNWLRPDKPNPFPETDEMRLTYFNEADELQNKVTSGGCPRCEITKLQISYRDKLREVTAGDA
jgi:hypothetical protein